MRKQGHILSLIVFLACAAPASAQIFVNDKVVFDSISAAPDGNGGYAPDPYLGAVTNTPQSFMGQAFTTIDPGIAGPLHITGMDFVLGSHSVTNYTNVVANFQFFNTYTGASEDFSPNSDVFANAATLTPVSISLGAISTTGSTSAGDYTIEHVSFISAENPDGISVFNSVSGYANLGLTVSIQGDTGSGLQAPNNLLSAGVRNRIDSPFAVGDVPSQRNSDYANNTEYFRNASGRTDYNFYGSDGRDLASPDDAEHTDQFFSALAMRLYAEGTLVLPEPSSLALLLPGGALGGMLLIRRRRAHRP